MNNPLIAVLPFWSGDADLAVAWLEWAKFLSEQPGGDVSKYLLLIFRRRNVPPETLRRMHDLVFDHYAYADPDAVAFKERFYGYDGALDAWKRLNERRGPVDVRGVLPWVHESAISYEIG